MSQKVDLSSTLVLGGAGLLFVSLFLHWFGVGDEGLSGWTTFETLDLVLAALAVGAAAIVSGRLDALWPAASRWLPALAGTAFVVIFVQLVNPPPLVQHADREAGIWIALVASALMSAGAALSVARVSVVLDVRGRDLGRRVPVVDRRPSAERPGPPEAKDEPAPRERDAASEDPAEAVDPDRTQAFDVLDGSSGEDEVHGDRT